MYLCMWCMCACVWVYVMRILIRYINLAHSQLKIEFIHTQATVHSKQYAGQGGEVNMSDLCILLEFSLYTPHTYLHTQAIVH